MNEWFTNPVVWIGIISVMSVLIGAIFGIGRWVGTVNANQTSFKAFMTEVRDDIKQILTRLSPATVTSGSPLRLTDLGRAISQTLDASEWAEGIAQTLTERIKGKQPYEIQDFCLEYIGHEFKPTAEQDAKIKACAYENGITSEKVRDVLAVELRDKLLAMMP